MFENGAPHCLACKEDIDEESASFVSVGEDFNQLESVNKPLFIFFLYSGVGVKIISSLLFYYLCLSSSG